jgi:cell division initiation protein
MKVTPLEIRQQQFPLRFRGYDPTAVDVFLELMAGQLDELLRENAQLREALAQKDQEIQGIREQEGDWKKALMTVQQTRDDLIERGQQQARLLVVEAERKAQRLLMEAKKTYKAIAQDVQALTRQRQHLTVQLRSLLEQHLTLLEAQGEVCEESRPEDPQGLLVEASDDPQDAGKLACGVGAPGNRTEKGAGGNSLRRSAITSQSPEPPGGSAEPAYRAS